MVSHTFSDPGSYDVTLSTVSSGGATNTDQQTLTISGTTLTPSIPAPSGPVKSGKSIAFSVTTPVEPRLQCGGTLATAALSRAAPLANTCFRRKVRTR